MSTKPAAATNDIETLADALVLARAEARPLAAFPGEIPPDLATAYAVQDAAIARSGRDVAGWKVAGVRPEWRAAYDAPRLAGPLFADTLDRAGGNLAVEIFAGGFAAVEAEFAFRVAHDIDPAVAAVADLLPAIGGLHIAMEIAGSPLAGLSELGPGAVIADHGNNSGMVIGDEIEAWQDRALAEMTSRMVADGREVGSGSAATVPGGPLEALLFLVGNLGSRGKSLKRGDWVATGTTTGVHRIAPGDSVVADFGALGTIAIKAVACPLR